MGLDPFTAALGVGGGMLLGGKDGGGDTSAADSQVELMRRLLEEGTPIREALGGRSQQFLEGGLDPSASAMFAPLKMGVERDFGRAKQSVLESGATGGALTSALANVEGRKAGALTEGLGAISQQELQNAMGLGFGQLPTISAGFGSAAASQAQQAASEAANKQGKGQALGKLGSAAIMAGSDRRYKKNIIKVGELAPGIPLYIYEYLGSFKTFIGVMADEVRHIPGAVYSVAGVEFVDYARVK